MTNIQLIDKLIEKRELDEAEWTQVFSTYDQADLEYAMREAHRIAIGRFGKKIYFRGIVEFTNICRNDCYYCGIRCSNHNIQRYRLDEEDILNCCRDGYEHGFRTFVLQGGEDPYFTKEKMCGIVRDIHDEFPDCAVTLSIGELDRDYYQALYDAGASRYLLRHETADPEHYSMLHP